MLPNQQYCHVRLRTFFLVITLSSMQITFEQLIGSLATFPARPVEQHHG
jgi:hypothetical protein